MGTWRMLALITAALLVGAGQTHPSKSSRYSFSCYFDWDCKGGLCCSTTIPGCIGYCLPCAKARNEEISGAPRDRFYKTPVSCEKILDTFLATSFGLFSTKKVRVLWTICSIGF
jgi:hypothetical protein